MTGPALIGYISPRLHPIENRVRLQRFSSFVITTTRRDFLVSGRLASRDSKWSNRRCTSDVHTNERSFANVNTNGGATQRARDFGVRACIGDEPT